LNGIGGLFFKNEMAFEQGLCIRCGKAGGEASQCLQESQPLFVKPGCPAARLNRQERLLPGRPLISFFKNGPPMPYKAGFPLMQDSNRTLLHLYEIMDFISISLLSQIIENII
jgi:hypothetical protein